MARTKLSDVERYKNVNHAKLRELVDESNFTRKDISRIVGLNDSWLTQTTERKTAIAKKDLERVCIILGVPVEELLVEEKEPKPEPESAVEENKTVQQAPAGDFASVVKILSEMAADVKAIRAAFDGMAERNQKIPVTRRERAVELLRKELISKNGGGVKVEEFKRMLTQAGIGSSYMADAINELGCRKMLGNNGINYIVKDEM